MDGLSGAHGFQMEKDEDRILILVNFVAIHGDGCRYALEMSKGLAQNGVKVIASEYTCANEVISEPIEVDVCTGCFMFFRMDVLTKCAGFDERFFMYFEDFDLTRRVKQFGKAMFIPQISVEHEWKRENKSGKTSKIMISSFVKYMLKWKSM